MCPSVCQNPQKTTCLAEVGQLLNLALVELSHFRRVVAGSGALETLNLVSTLAFLSKSSSAAALANFRES